MKRDIGFLKEMMGGKSPPGRYLTALRSDTLPTPTPATQKGARLTPNALNATNAQAKQPKTKGQAAIAKHLAQSLSKSAAKASAMAAKANQPNAFAHVGLLFLEGLHTWC